MQINTLNSPFISSIKSSKSASGSKVSFKGEDPAKSSDVLISIKKNFDATVDEASKILKPIIIAEKDGLFSRVLARGLSHFANSRPFKALANKGNALETILVLGNTLKEAVGTTIYTVQALTNEDLAPDKRKFIGMYDLAVGTVSTTLSFVFGLAALKYKDSIASWLVGSKAIENKLPGVKSAIAGVAFMIPLVLQNIIIKRVIAPAVAVPLAGGLKAKMEAKEAAKKDMKNPEEIMSPIPSETLILAKTPVESQTNKFRQRLG